MNKVVPLEKIYKIKDRVLSKKVKRSLHQLRRPPAWCIQKEVLEKARVEGIERVKILDKETNISYMATLNLIFEKGFVIDRGFGEQIALPLHLWEVDDPNQLKLF